MIESIQFVLAFLKYLPLKMVGVALLEYRRNLASLKQLYKLGKEKKSHSDLKRGFLPPDKGSKKVTRVTQMLIIAIHRLEEIHCHQNYMGREGGERVH